jgi:hypothetical protein
MYRELQQKPNARSAPPALPAQAMHRLYRLLSGAGIDRMLLGHETGVSVLSVHSELTIWCFNGRIRWCATGADGSRQSVTHPAGDVEGAASRLLAYLKGAHEHLEGKVDSLPEDGEVTKSDPPPDERSAAVLMAGPAPSVLRFRRPRRPVTVRPPIPLPRARSHRAEREGGAVVGRPHALPEPFTGDLLLSSA